MIHLKQDEKEIDAVIFDLGNVLLRYTPRIFLSQVGIEPELHDKIAKVLFENHEIWQDLDRGTKDNMGIAEAASQLAPRLRREIHHYMKNWAEHFHAIPENVEAMYRIKETGTKVYILSNFSHETFALMEKRNAFLQDFDGRIISAQHGVIKPEPEIYDLLIRSFSLDPARSVFIDDLEVNLVAARKAGLNTILLKDCEAIAPYFIFPESSQAL